ncbi:hypothetical protein ACFE04_019394 [Oxalis oulophora]
MGIFSTSSPFDADVDKVTPEEDRSTEDWGSMLDICDKVGDSSQNAKDCLKSIIRRLNNPNPHVVLKAITLLDVCVKNCLKVFHLEIASREFEQEFRKIMKKTIQHQPKWVENEFKTDPQLSLIPALYAKLKQEGVDFSNISDNTPKDNSSSTQLKDPNTVTSQQEVDDIAKVSPKANDFLKEKCESSKLKTYWRLATWVEKLSVGTRSSFHYRTNKMIFSQGFTAVCPIMVDESSLALESLSPGNYEAIELSLKETNSSPAFTNLYPSTINVTGSGGPKSFSQNSAPKQKILVKALYDFEAAEDNELTFHTGEIIEIIDDSDKNWWKGKNQRGEGLFPANFVTSDLSPSGPSSELEIKTEQTGKKSHVKFNDTVSVNITHDIRQETLVINEQKIDRLLHLLHEANPTNESADTEEMLKLEGCQYLRSSPTASSYAWPKLYLYKLIHWGKNARTNAGY